MKNKLFLLIASLLIAVTSQAGLEQMPSGEKKLFDTLEATALNEKSTIDVTSIANCAGFRELFHILHLETKAVVDYIFALDDGSQKKISAELHEYIESSSAQLEEMPHLIEMWKLVNSHDTLKQFKIRIVSIFSTLHAIVVIIEHRVYPLCSSKQLVEMLTYFCAEVESIVPDAEKKDLIEARNLALRLAAYLD